MKKGFLLIIVLMLVFMTSCYISVEKDKKEMLEIYCEDSNYITFIGEIVEINIEEQSIWLTIKCDDSNNTFIDKRGMCRYLVFSESLVGANVGDVVEYTTVKVRHKSTDWLPIVEIKKNNEIIFNYQTGKNNLIDWVNQLNGK